MVQEDILCDRCSDSCYGDVIHVGGKYYHQYCFSCIKCKKDLLKHGYFFIDGEFYCNNDYYKLMGTLCAGCGKYVEGEVITAIDSVYHPGCFGCGRCRKIFPPGVKITFDGDLFLCDDCNKPIERYERSPPNQDKSIEQFERSPPHQNKTIEQFEKSPPHRDKPTEQFERSLPHQNKTLEQFERSPPHRDKPTEQFERSLPHQNKTLEQFERSPPHQDKPTEQFERFPPHQNKTTEQFERSPPHRDKPTEQLERFPPHQNKTIEQFEKDPPYEVQPMQRYQRSLSSEVNGEKVVITNTSKSSDSSISNCAGCGNDIKSGQALLALEKQWHLWCFICNKCGCLLAGEYMGRDGVPYCEQDYQTEFGVSCSGCSGYITGKVLQAGEKHYHPQCSRCAKCGQMFGEGEEMYLQGSEIWHPQCSEEYQREHEEADNQWLAENDFQYNSRDEEPVTTSSPRSPKSQLRIEARIASADTEKPLIDTSTYSFSKHNVEAERQTPSPPQSDDNNNTKEKLPYNGYNNHVRQSSYSSEGSADVKSNLWQPPSYQTATSKPAGFRSVRPPQMSSSISVKPVATNNVSHSVSDEEDPPPPVPPPPTRTTSNAFREKYASGVYSATPFQKQAPSKSRPLSYIESAAKKVSTEKTPAATARTTISITTRSTSSTSSNNDEKDGPTKIYKKGAGVNKLQARKSMSHVQKDNDLGPTELNAETKRKLKEDKTYPYEVLKNGSYKMPLDVDKTIREVYLDDQEFCHAFQMTRDKYYALPKWKQDELKKKALLF